MKVSESIYHVKPDGNDANLGTLSLPWKTVEKLKAVGESNGKNSIDRPSVKN